MELTACFYSRNLQMKKVILGQTLKRLRTAKGLSQAELGRLSGFESNTISRFELGSVTPSVDALYKIAEALNVQVKDFFLDIDDDAQKRAFLFEVICNADSDELTRLIGIINLPKKAD